MYAAILSFFFFKILKVFLCMVNMTLLKCKRFTVPPSLVPEASLLCCHNAYDWVQWIRSLLWIKFFHN